VLLCRKDEIIWSVVPRRQPSHRTDPPDRQSFTGAKRARPTAPSAFPDAAVCLVGEAGRRKPISRAVAPGLESFERPRERSILAKPHQAKGARHRAGRQRSVRRQVEDLRSVAARYDDDSRQRQTILLAALLRAPLPISRALNELTHVLIFIAAHPASPEIERAAYGVLDRVAEHLRRQPAKARRSLENTGLPYTPTLSTYSHDLLNWMLRSRHYRIRFDAFWQPDMPLSQALAFTLPPLQSDLTALDVDGRGLLARLVPRADERLSFLVKEFSRLDDRPTLKDFLFDGLHLYLRLQPKSQAFSEAFNRIPKRATYIHNNLRRTVEPRAVARCALPRPRRLTTDVRDSVITAARHAMMLLQRETDPTTHVDPASLRLFDLERGVTIGIYGMVASRQLPLESYVGYTLFKNGFAAAYGGAWIFARHAQFGINVFESFRGGESAFLLCQLLRVYRQVFGVDHFEVEPYQYGQGNPEGIRSGAFWFYFRHGFRPVQPALNALAREQWRRIGADARHRTPASVLRQLAEGPIALKLNGRVRTSAVHVRDMVTTYIQTSFGGDRVGAEAASRRRFVDRAGSPGRLGADQQRVFTEVALWAAAENIRGGVALALLRQMIRVKPVDVYGYQRLLLRLRL